MLAQSAEDLERSQADKPAKKASDESYVRYSSRRGTYNTVTFSMVDAMPAILRGGGRSLNGDGSGAGSLDAPVQQVFFCMRLTFLCVEHLLRAKSTSNYVRGLDNFRSTSLVYFMFFAVFIYCTCMFLPQKCVITGLPAKYRDPRTMLPYATAAAFKEIRRRYPNGISGRVHLR